MIHTQHAHFHGSLLQSPFDWLIDSLPWSLHKSDPLYIYKFGFFLERKTESKTKTEKRSWLLQIGQRDFCWVFLMGLQNLRFDKRRNKRRFALLCLTKIVRRQEVKGRWWERIFLLILVPMPNLIQLRSHRAFAIYIAHLSSCHFPKKKKEKSF